jgi:hypothetical protein
VAPFESAPGSEWGSGLTYELQHCLGSRYTALRAKTAAEARARGGSRGTAGGTGLACANAVKRAVQAASPRTPRGRGVRVAFGTKRGKHGSAQSHARSRRRKGKEWKRKRRVEFGLAKSFSGGGRLKQR